MIEEIRRLLTATPFRPFEIVLSNGNRYAVPHPDFVSISPKGGRILLWDENEGPSKMLSALDIASVEELMTK